MVWCFSVDNFAPPQDLCTGAAHALRDLGAMDGAQGRISGAPVAARTSSVGQQSLSFAISRSRSLSWLRSRQTCRISIPGVDSRPRARTGRRGVSPPLAAFPLSIHAREAMDQEDDVFGEVTAGLFKVAGGHLRQNGAEYAGCICRALNDSPRLFGMHGP